MKHLKSTSPERGERGVIFLALMLVLLVTGSTIVIAALNNRNSAALAQKRDARLEMEQAKAALLAYAANYAKLSNDAHGPGFFPCPDIDNDPNGAADFATATNSPCNASTPIVGRLPVYEEIAGTRYEISSKYANLDDQRFWYVVAPRYVYPFTAGNRRSFMRTYAIETAGFNEATDYWLTLDGEDGFVAFIIDPGEELVGQNRAGGSTNYANYLDGLNGGSGFDYFTSYSNNPALFNDRILGITFDEYMLHVGTAVARDMKLRLDAYNASGSTVNSRRYPPNYPTSGGGTNATTTCESGTFRSIFNNSAYGTVLQWLRGSGSGNTGERWSCGYSVYWVRDSSNLDRGTLKFNGCPGLSFTFQFLPTSSFTRNGTGC